MQLVGCCRRRLEDSAKAEEAAKESRLTFLSFSVLHPLTSVA